MEAMLRNMHNPAYRDSISGKVEELKKDPEIGSILEEIQQGGPAAMMKCVPTAYVLSLGACRLCKLQASGMDT